MSSSAVLSTRRETHPHHPLPSKPNAVNNCTFHPKRGPPTPPPAFGTKRGPQLYFPPEARSTPTTPCFRYETRSITVLVMDLVCINELCEDELCVDEMCANELCEDELCEDELCENEMCANELCENEMCANELCLI